MSATGAVQDAQGILISTEAGNQLSPALAWDGSNYLVAWTDFRSGASYDIYGARVSAAGVLQDAAGVPISTAANNQLRPAVAWNGANHLVAWHDLRSGTTFDIYGARVSAAGAVQDTSGVPISTAAGPQFAPALASNGTDFLVAWQDARSDPSFDVYDIYGARVSAAGAVQDAAGIPISAAPSDQVAPALAWNGTNNLVAWENLGSNGTSDIYGARVSGAGAVQDPAGLPITTAASFQEATVVAWNGTNFLVAWMDSRSGTNSDVYGARVNAAGVVQDR